MAETPVSRDAALHAARVALAELKAKGWQSNPAYWVGRLESALAGVVRTAGPTLPATEGHGSEGCGAVDPDDLDACGKCSDCTA